MRVYVIVGSDGVGIVVKRVLNQLKGEQRLILRSDNEFYPEYWAEVWEVKGYISTSTHPRMKNNSSGWRRI